jgi:hypothetical protein
MTKFAAKLSTAALVGTFATGIVLMVVGSDDVPVIVSQAIAAPTLPTAGVGYFPSQFPTPDAPAAPHVEAF